MAETESNVERIHRESRERIAALKERKENAPPPPTHQSLCLEHTLYSPIQLNPDRDEQWLTVLKYRPVQFDAHCIYCGRSATFRTMTDRFDEEFITLEKHAEFNAPAKQKFKRLKFEGGQFALHIGCSRRPEHFYSYFFTFDDHQAILTKIGQTPSLEDVAGADIDRYRKILGSDFSELRRATGLFAHGIGIGAFIYLRRIFERLIDDARLASGLSEGDVDQLRMSEKVETLSEWLPPALVKFKSAYGILSKGVHELTEDECKRYFPTIRASIIMMLEERYVAEQKQRAAIDLEREFRAIEGLTGR